MEISWSEMALHQLDEILDKVQEDYGERIAYKTYDKIDKKVNGLIRHLLVYPNVIYYNVDGDVINIMLIAHTKQSPRTVINMIRRYYEHGGE